jgi:hypothetical protein
MELTLPIGSLAQMLLDDGESCSVHVDPVNDQHGLLDTLMGAH